MTKVIEIWKKDHTTNYYGMCHTIPNRLYLRFPLKKIEFLHRFNPTTFHKQLELLQRINIITFHKQVKYFIEVQLNNFKPRFLEV